MAKNIVNLKIDGTSYSARPYGTCTTAAGTAAKAVTCADFSLTTGATILVKFTYANSVASPTLNVNNTGAKPIYYRGAALGSSLYYWGANDTVEFYYNGTQWDLMDVGNTNYYPTKFAWTNGTTAGPTGSLTGSGMSAVSFGAIPSASASISGVVTTGAQTFAGSKTFNDNITATKFITKNGTSSQVVKGDGSLENENSLSVASAGKLTTPRTISLTGAASGSVSFDGSKDIGLIVNYAYDNYIHRLHESTDYANFAQNLSLADSSAPEFSTNRLLYCKSSAFNIEYSNNAGSSWTKLNVSDEKIFNFVNTTQGFGLGNKSSNQTASNDRLRITINWDCGVYINLQRILIYLSTGGAKCIKCKYEYSYIGTEDTYIDKGTWDMTGWSGWNKLSVDKGFGNNNNVGWNIANIRLTFYFDEYQSTKYEGKVYSSIWGIRFIGETLYSNNTGYKLPQTGHLYDYNYLGDATFPATLTATKFITKGGTSSQFVRGDGSCAALTKENVTSALGLTPTANKGTVTSVATGVGLTGGSITTSGTIKCNLNSETSLGTIGSTSKLYAVGVDANNKLCVNVPWSDSNTNYYPTKFTWSNGTSSAGPTGSLTGSGMSAVSFGAIPTATTGRYGVVKLSNSFNNSSDSEAATAGAVNAAYQSLSALIEANKYTLPAATSSTLGGVKIGSNISVSSGTISLTKSNVTSALGYTPPTTNTTYGLANFESNGLMSATTFTTMSEDSAISNLTNISFETDPLGDKVSVYAKQGVTYVYYTRGENDYIESGVVGTIDIPAATTTKAGVMSAADKTKLNGIATGANKYTLPNATSSTLGGVKIGSNISVSSGTISLTKSNVTSALGYTPIGPTGDYTVGNLTGNSFTATDSTGYSAAITSDNIYLTGNDAEVEIKVSGITAPKFITTGGTSSQFVRGNGSCTALTKSEVTTALGYTPPTTNTTYGVATTSTAGLMSAADKTKLNSLFPAVEEITYNGSTNGDETLQNILECIGKWAYKNNGACKILVMNPNGVLMYGSFDIFSTWVKRNSPNNDWGYDTQIIQFSGFINPHAIDDGPYTCKYGHLYGYIVYGDNGLDSYTVQQSGDSDWYYEM